MPAPTNIVEALIEVMRDVGVVRKDSRNVQQGFRFRGIDEVLNAVGPALRRHGVIIVPELLDVERERVTTAKGGTMIHVILRVRYGFYCSAGDNLEVTVPGESFDAGDKAVAKAMSVALRTALIQVLALPTDEPDPDSESHQIIGEAAETAELLIYEIGNTAVSRGLDVDGIREQWAQSHDGQDIRDATDVRELRRFRDEVFNDQGRQEG